MREFFVSHFLSNLFIWVAALMSLHLFVPNANAAGLQLMEGESWVVVASRHDLQEATDLARAYGRQVESVRVVRSINGWFAVVLGPIAALSIDDARAKFARKIVLPNDAYLSQGDRYLETVFMTTPPTASELQLTGSDNWVVVASRHEQQEALDIARSYGQQGSEVRVVRSKNGWFAVVLGPISVSSIEEARVKYAPRVIIPSDAYLSHGERYVATVFVAPAAVGGASPPPSSIPSPRASSEGSTGSGFFISPQGHLLTNAHVVEECTSIQIQNGQDSPRPARLIARDTTNDLAILKTDYAPQSVATFRYSVRLGENVAAFGFPLTGLLTAGGNFTLGNVTALAGIKDDSRMLQISAPVQPGNSGGPLLDETGTVVGIVVAKLNALKLAEATNDLAQNVNFAIKASVAQSFADSQGVRLQAAKADLPVMRPADIAERAKSFTGLVECKQ